MMKNEGVGGNEKCTESGEHIVMEEDKKEGNDDTSKHLTILENNLYKHFFKKRKKTFCFVFFTLCAFIGTVFGVDIEK